MLKRGAMSGEVVAWFPRWIFAIIVIITFLAITQLYIVREVSVTDAESIVMAERFIISEMVIAAEDGAGNARIGRIAMEKFGNTIDDAAAFPSPSHMGAFFDVEDEQLVYQEFYASRYLPLARRGIEGPQGAQLLEWEVLVLDGEGKAKLLKVSVVTPNE